MGFDSDNYMPLSLVRCVSMYSSYMLLLLYVYTRHNKSRILMLEEAKCFGITQHGIQLCATQFAISWAASTGDLLPLSVIRLFMQIIVVTFIYHPKCDYLACTLFNCNKYMGMLCTHNLTSALSTMQSQKKQHAGSSLLTYHLLY